MSKLLTTLSVLTATILLSGCENIDTIPIKNIEQNNKIATKAKVSKSIIKTGETIDYEVSNSSNIMNIAWRDQNDKLLSTKTKFNRLFQNEGEYTTTLTFTEKNGNTFTDTISIKVNKHSLVDETSNLQPVIQATAEKLELMEKESIHLSDDGSYDPDGEIINYAWRDMNGILLSETKTLDRVMYYYPQFDTNNDGTTRYVKTLYVTDNKGALASKSFTIIVHKQEPVKDEKTDQVVNVVDYEYASSNHGTITYTYDKNGKLLSEKVIRYDEYTLVSTILITYTYNENGNMLTASIDSDYDGEINGTTAFTYDENGNMLTRIESGNVGWTHSKHGGIVLFDNYKGNTTTWTYDENGDMLTKSFDRYSDGTIDLATSFSDDTIAHIDRYDKDGNMYKILTKSYDWDSNGMIDRIFTYTYNEDGSLKSKTYDIDKSKKYVYSYYDDYIDSFGNVKYDYDVGIRKITQEIPEYIEALSTYYKNGEVHKLVLNTESDGKTPYNEYYYSKNGNLISFNSHVSAAMAGNNYYNYDSEDKNMIMSGNTESPVKKTHTYDENGNMLTKEIEHPLYKIKKHYSYNEDNIMTSTTTYSYDDDSTTTKDFIYNYSYTYDENKNMLTQEASDGNDKITITYTWGII